MRTRPQRREQWKRLWIRMGGGPGSRTERRKRFRERWKEFKK